MTLVRWHFYELGGGKFEVSKMVNVAVYAMRFATGSKLPRGVVLLGRGRGTIERIREQIWRW